MKDRAAVTMVQMRRELVDKLDEAQKRNQALMLEIEHFRLEIERLLTEEERFVNLGSMRREIEDLHHKVDGLNEECDEWRERAELSEETKKRVHDQEIEIVNLKRRAERWKRAAKHQRERLVAIKEVVG